MTRKKHRITVVGAGLFGCVAAAYARAEGHIVTVIDDARPYRASPASGCVLAPSWLSSLEKPDVENAMALLSSLYTVHDLEFQTNLFKTFKAKRVVTRDVLRPPEWVGRVTAIQDGRVDYTTKQGAGSLRGIVLVAAGIWCGELLTGLPPIRGLYGASLRVPGQLKAPLINAYAPYRQAVAFNLDKANMWFGDGTALIEKTWDAESVARVKRTQDRMTSVVGRAKLGLGVVTIGARPYVEGHKAGYFQRVSSQVWVSTGGAKNGTVLAAHQALQFLKELP